MPGKKNYNALLGFFKKPRSFRRTVAGAEVPFAADIFGRQKDLIRILSSIPESRYSHDTTLGSKSTMLSKALSGERIFTHRSACELKRELMLAMKHRFTEELRVSEEQYQPLMEEFETVFDPIYFVEAAAGKPRFNLTCGPLDNLKKARALA